MNFFLLLWPSEPNRWAVFILYLLISSFWLSYNNPVLDELVRRNFQVQRSRTLPDSATCVVVRTVTRAIVSTKFTGVGDRHASKMRTHSYDDQPFGILDSLVIVLLVAKRCYSHALLPGNFFLVPGRINQWISQNIANIKRENDDFVVFFQTCDGWKAAFHATWRRCSFLQGFRRALLRS